MSGFEKRDILAEQEYQPGNQENINHF